MSHYRGGKRVLESARLLDRFFKRDIGCLIKNVYSPEQFLDLKHTFVITKVGCRDQPELEPHLKDKCTWRVRES